MTESSQQEPVSAGSSTIPKLSLGLLMQNYGPASMWCARYAPGLIVISDGRFLVKRPFDEEQYEEPPPPKFGTADQYFAIFGAPARRTARLALGELLAWASRRSGFGDISDMLGHTVGRMTEASPQSCFGFPFDRTLLREAWQVFVDLRLDWREEAMVELATDPLGQRDSRGRKARMLRVTCGGATAVLMGLDPASVVPFGDDMPEGVKS